MTFLISDSLDLVYGHARDGLEVLGIFGDPCAFLYQVLVLAQACGAREGASVSAQLVWGEVT